MPTDAGNAAGSFAAQVGRRWQAIDPLLPAGGDQPSGCGARLIVAGAGGEQAATGTCEHHEGSPDSLDLTWGAARRLQLTVRLAGPDAVTALDQLLSLWRVHLDGVPGADGKDAAAIVTWPSRDIDGAATLLRHGLAPLSVIAARAARRHPAGPADGPPGERRPPRARDRPPGTQTVPPRARDRLPRTRAQGSRACGSGGPGRPTSTRSSAWYWKSSGSTRISAASPSDRGPRRRCDAKRPGCWPCQGPGSGWPSVTRW
jgi:hypothetical protein